MTLDVALIPFGDALGDVKRAFSEQYGVCVDKIQIIIDPSNEVTIFSTDRIGEYLNCYRDWVETDFKFNK